MAVDQMESRALAVADVVQLPTHQTTAQKLALVRQFQMAVHELFVPGHDFGVIPGTDKPTLLKPGAEKLCGLLELAPTYPLIEKLEDWERGFFAYTVTCRLVQIGTGLGVAEGVGSCNSKESRYRYRWVWPNELSQEERHKLEHVRGAIKEFNRKGGGKVKKYRVENDDIYSQANTILKMAKKRALVDAALSAGRLSDAFTQDIEDFSDDSVEEPIASQPANPPANGTANGPANGAAPSRPAPREDGIERITDEQDPRWKRWVKLMALAVTHKIPIAKNLQDLPVPVPAVEAASKSIAQALEKAGVDPAEFDSEGTDEDPDRDAATTGDQAEIAF